jgi:hypothetical protein
MTSRERNMLIGLGVVAVVALAFFFLVMGGEEEPEQTAPTPPTSSPAPIPATPGTDVGEPTEEPTEEPPRTVTFFGGRDPFVPLIEEPTTDGTTDGGTTPTDGGTTPPDGEPTDGATTPPPDGDPTDGDGIAVTGRPVVLVDVIDDSTVNVEIEGDSFTVTEGQRFAQSYQVVSVEANCARFLYGDESFSLCEGVPPR